MRKQKFLTCAICLIWAVALAGCGAPTAQQPESNTAASEPAAPAVEVVAEEAPTEAPVEEVVVVEPTATPVEEAAAVVDDAAGTMAVAYGSYPPEWINRNILGNPDATVLVEAYEEFM